VAAKHRPIISAEMYGKKHTAGFNHKGNNNRIINVTSMIVSTDET
jgi:hypothetical protein